MRQHIFEVAVVVNLAILNMQVYAIKRARRLRSPWKKDEKRHPDDIEKYLKS